MVRNVHFPKCTAFVMPQTGDGMIEIWVAVCRLQVCIEYATDGDAARPQKQTP